MRPVEKNTSKLLSHADILFIVPFDDNDDDECHVLNSCVNEFIL